MLSLAAIAKAVMDTLMFHYSTSIFKKRNRLFWDPAKSWRNKYALGKPEQGAKFFLSTTLLVGITDAWHLFQMIKWALVFGAVYLSMLTPNNLLHQLYLVLIARISFGLFFTLFYKHLLLKRKS